MSKHRSPRRCLPRRSYEGLGRHAAPRPPKNRDARLVRFGVAVVVAVIAAWGTATARVAPPVVEPVAAVSVDAQEGCGR
jgi:hypothetical protein